MTFSTCHVSDEASLKNISICSVGLLRVEISINVWCLTNDHVWCEERESAAHASHHCQAWLDMAPGPGPYSHNLVSATHCIAPIINPAPAVTASIYSFFSQYKTVFRSTRHHLKRIFSRVESELMSRSGGTSLWVVGAEWKREWLVSRPVLARGQASCDWSVVSHVTAILSCDWSAELSSGWSGVLQHTDMISIHEPWLCINISQNNLIKNMQCSCLHRINNISFIMSLIAHQMNEKLNTCQSDEFIWIKFHFSCNWRFLLWPVAFKYDHNSLSAMLSFIWMSWFLAKHCSSTTQSVQHDCSWLPAAAPLYL